MTGWIRARLSRLSGLLGRRPHDADFDDEVELHLQLLAERYEREGMSPGQAMTAARRQFGNTTRLREDRSDLQTFPAAEHVWRAVRYGLRQLRRTPAFTAAAVFSIALGIGVNATVFTLLDQLVLRLLPVSEPERLVMIWSTGPNLGDTREVRASSVPVLREFQRRAVAFDNVFCRTSSSVALTIGKDTEPARAELVSGNYFEALRVGPAAGRVFSSTADDTVDRGHPVVVLSHRYWSARLGGRGDVVGTKVLVNRHPMEVVGIADAGFNGIDPAQAPDLWLPVRMKALVTPEEDGLNDPHYEFVQVFGRLKAGYTVQSASTTLQPLFHQLLEAQATDPQISRQSPYDRQQFLKRTVVIERAANGYSSLRERYSTALAVLMGMAAVILLIACSNVASLLVARGVARQKEISVRLSIGASRRALVGQLLVESLMLAVSGAVLGLALSAVAARALLAMLPANGPALLLHADPDLRVLLFGIAATLVTGLLFGIAPALQSTRLDLVASLKDEAGAVVGTVGSARLRKALVAAQVALSFLLLVGSGLFARTLANLKHADSGLQSIDHLVTFGLNPAKSGYTVPQLRRFYDDVLREVRATPDVDAAAFTWMPLLQGWAPGWHTRVEGHVAKEGENVEIEDNIVSPDYWRTMGIKVVEGRDFDARDAFESVGRRKRA